MAGLISGLLRKDDLTELETCLRVSHSVVETVSTIIKNIVKLDITQMVKSVQLFTGLLNAIPMQLVYCPKATEDIPRLVKWGDLIFGNILTLFSTITGNVMKNFAPMLSDATALTGSLLNG